MNQHDEGINPGLPIRFRAFFIVLLLSIVGTSMYGQKMKMEKRGLWGLNFKGPAGGNPYYKHRAFRCFCIKEDRTVKVSGFYDGQGQ